MIDFALGVGASRAGGEAEVNGGCLKCLNMECTCLAEAQQKLAAIRELHREHHFAVCDTGPRCAVCDTEWPCPTVAIVDGTPGGEQR